MKCHVFLPELDGYVSPVAPIPFNCIGTESKWKINCYCKYLIGRESVKKKKSLQELTFSTLEKVLKEMNQILKRYRQHCSEQWLYLMHFYLIPKQPVQLYWLVSINKYLSENLACFIFYNSHSLYHCFIVTLCFLRRNKTLTCVFQS